MADRRTRATQFIVLWCLLVSYLAAGFVVAAPAMQTGDPNDPMTGTLVYEITVSVAPDEPIGRWFQEGTATEGGYLYRARIETNDAYVHVGYGTDASCQEMIDVAFNYLGGRELTADKYLSVVPVDDTTGYFCISYRKTALQQPATATIQLYRLNEISLNATIAPNKLEITGPIDESRVSDEIYYAYELEVTDVPFRISYQALRHYRREPDSTSVSEIVRTPPEQQMYASIIYIYDEAEDSSQRIFLNDSHLIQEPGTYELRITHRGELRGEDSEGRDMGNGAIFAQIKGEPWAQVPLRCTDYEVEINRPEGPPISLSPGEVDARLYYTNDEEFDWSEVEPGPDEPILNVNIAGISRTITYGEIGIQGPNHKTWRISSGGPDGQVIVTTPYPFHDGDNALLVVCPPGVFDDDTVTPTPTPAAVCTTYQLGRTPISVEISASATLRALAGVPIILYQGEEIEISPRGYQWPHTPGEYEAVAGFEVAELEVCGEVFNPTPSVTATVPVSPSVTPTIPIPPSATPTGTPATATPTGTLLPTPTIPTEAPCEGEVWNVPVIPDVVRVRLDTGLKIAVLDATVYINVGESAQTLRPGSYEWGFPGESYDVYSLTSPARLIVCNLEPLPSPSAIASPPPTWETDPDEDACIAPPTLAPTDNTGNLPELGLVVPTMQELPTHVTITATMTITDIDVLSTTLELATVIIAPVQTMTAWCQQEFGPDGWQRGQVDAQPIVALLAGALGWLALFGLLGPLNWLVPPVLITVLIRVGRAVLSIIKYIKQIIPFQ